MRNPFAAIRRCIRPAGVLAAVAGIIAVVNRGLRTANRPPHDPIAGAHRRWTWLGHEMSATELGDGEPAILLIHGISAGASSHEYRVLAPLLAEHRRVITLDLLGCGLSGHPNIDYSADLFVDQIIAALCEFTSSPAIVAGSGLGAAFAIRAAVRVPKQISHVIAICPEGLNEQHSGVRAILHGSGGTIMRSPVLGEAISNAFATTASLRRELTRHVYADQASVTPEVLAHYYALTHQPGARFVPAAYTAGALSCDVARDLPFIGAPLLICWGTRASRSNSPENADEYMQLAVDARLVMFAHSATRPHEEEAEAVAAAIEAFLETTTPATGESAYPAC
jgi:pimeloyl-ACP methyl ester carboxylesterase